MDTQKEIDHPSYTPLAVITGASRGIGYELAMQFAENGFDLLIAAEDEGIIDVVHEFEAFGAGVDSLQVDLSTEIGVEKLFARIHDMGRPVDALAINAGIAVGGDFTRGTDLRKELTLIHLNVISAVYLAKLVLPQMVARGEGKVLFTSSIVSGSPGPFEAVYAASKAFIQSFASSLREELKESGVTITSLLPGPTDTEIFHRAGMGNTRVGTVEKFENSPKDVARVGFQALMAGKSDAIAGNYKTQIMAVANRLLPDGLKAKIHRQFTKPGSAPRL